MPNESNIDVSETRSGERRGSSDGHPLTPNDPPLLPCYRPKHSHAPRDSCANREQCESLPGRVCQGGSKCAPADCVRDGLITWGWLSARAMHGALNGMACARDGGRLCAHAHAHVQRVAVLHNTHAHHSARVGQESRVASTAQPAHLIFLRCAPIQLAK